MTFEQFFTAATRDRTHPNGDAAHGYHCRRAADPECQARLIKVSTSLGKTAAAVIA
jgi:hypothetical protein